MSKIKNFSVALLCLSLLMVGAVSVSAQAADDSKIQQPHENRPRLQNLSDEELATMKAKHDAVHQAIETADYEAFEKATNGDEKFANITSENFGDLVKAHKLMEEAKAIMESLGLESPGGQFGHGPHGPKEVE